MSRDRWDRRSLSAFLREASQFSVRAIQRLESSSEVSLALARPGSDLVVDPEGLLAGMNLSDLTPATPLSEQIPIEPQRYTTMLDWAPSLEIKGGEEVFSTLLGIARFTGREDASINYTLPTQTPESASLLGRLRSDLLAYFSNILSKRATASSRHIEISANDLTRRSGILFAESVLRLATSEGKQDQADEHIDDIQSSLFENCGIIASMRYESKECLGEMVLCKSGHPAVPTEMVSLAQSVKLSEHRGIRKLLESSSPNRPLLVLDGEVIGWGKIKAGYDPSLGDVFRIRFVRDQCWELLHEKTTLMRVARGHPLVPKPTFNFTKASELAQKVGCDQHNAHAISSFVGAVIDSQHGGMIVISTEAADEANRLSEQAFRVRPCRIAPEHAPLADIDGAILLDPNANLQAFGVILDGLVAAGLGGRERGARFNSARRYQATRRNEANADVAIIVISEDGMINLFDPIQDKDQD